MRPSEPVYAGRTLTSWLQDLDREADDPSEMTPEEAVQTIGTNAIPVLMDLIQRRDTRLKLKAVDLLRQQSLVSITFTPAYAHHWHAIWGFRALGATAKPAVPHLLKLLQDDDKDVRVSAAMALRSVDPESAKKAGVH